MSEESRIQRYLRLVREEEEAFERASRNYEVAGPQRRETITREWFEASAKLIQEHWRSHATEGDGGRLEPYPGNAIFRLAKIAEALAAGRIPDPIKDLRAAGGHPRKWPGQRRDIATALQYIDHARNGAITDHRFIVTISEAFSVDRTTVHEWQQNRDELLQDMQELPAHHFPEALREAGARYHFNRTGERTPGVE